VRWIGKKGIHHCGYCVPCLYRRIAMMTIGWDDAADYGYDVFQQLSSLTTHKQSDFRALVGFAQRIASATPAARELMVLAHGSFSPSVGASIGPHAVTDLSPWSDMLLRWATDFLEKVTSLSAPATKRILGMPSGRRIQPP
jgi:hypothetical protein